MATIKNESRRDFIKASAAVGGGLALGFYLPGRVSTVHGAEAAQPNAWVRIAPDNTVTILVARSEMGQDVATSMPMLVAEELEVDINKVKVDFAPPGEAYINSLLGGQLTGGSTSVRDGWEKLRKAGASARMMLVAAAAQDWGVDAAQCKAENGVIKGPGGKQVTYGAVAAKAAQLEPPKNVPLKPASAFKVIGNPKQKRLDTPGKVAGQPMFGIDKRVPGMLYAACAISPYIGGKPKSYDDARAGKMPGVKAVVEYTRGVAVVATSYWQAKKAKDLLDIEWDQGENAGLSQAKIWAGLHEASKQPGAVFRNYGDADGALAQAAKTVSATYQLPFLSHSPMEPMNAVVHVMSDKALVIVPTQFQQIVPHVVAGVSGLKPEQVEVQTTYLGGGFGRRIDVDYIIDAAEISKAAGGVPVKMVWSREDDMTHDFYRPAGLYAMTAGLDSSGNLIALRFASTSPSITSRVFPSLVKDGLDPLAVEGIDNFPYAVPNLKFTYQMHDTGVKVGYWRAVSHNLNAVALESFIDECANAAGKDPIAYRLSMLDMDPSHKHKLSIISAGGPVGERMKTVLETVREKSGWDKPLSGAGRGRGVAVMEGYNTVTAMVVEVTASSNNDITVDRVVAVVDAGPRVHPDQAQAQIESQIIFGQSACLYGEITVKNNSIEQSNFDQYRIVRMNESPKKMEITWMPPSPNQGPGGLGEPATAVVQGAIANAIFAATGKRVRVLPFTPENISAA
jgi:isoquinoline 1-oxidoreductase subunit beta